MPQMHLCVVLLNVFALPEVVPVPSLQPSSVVQPLMLLQMVNEVALVEPLGPQ